MTPKLAKGEVMLQVKVDEATKEQLQQLAGSSRGVGRYLDAIVPVLFSAREEIDAAVREAQQKAIADVLARRDLEATEEG